MLTCESIAWKQLAVLFKPTDNNGCISQANKVFGRQINSSTLPSFQRQHHTLSAMINWFQPRLFNWHKLSRNITISTRGTEYPGQLPCTLTTVSTQCRPTRTPRFLKSRLTQQPSDTQSSGKASRWNNPRSPAHEQIIDAVCRLTRLCLHSNKIVGLLRPLLLGCSDK